MSLAVEPLVFLKAGLGDTCAADVKWSRQIPLQVLRVGYCQSGIKARSLKSLGNAQAKITTAVNVVSGARHQIV